MQFANPKFSTNTAFRGALRQRNPVKPMRPASPMRPLGMGQEMGKPAQPAQPEMGKPAQPSQPMPQPAPVAARAPQSLMPPPTQADPKVMAQAKDAQASFTQMANSFAAKPEVVAMSELGKQLQTMDPNSQQAVDLKVKLEQARSMLQQSPEYLQMQQANQALQQRVAEEQAFQQGYAGQ